MKRFGFVGILAVALLLAGTAWAAETREEKALDRSAADISKNAGTEKGATVVTQRIEKEFGVTEAQVTALRDKKLGYGEISIVYSLASKMPGGITDANVQQVMTLRQGPPVMGWGEIAKKLDLKLGPAVSQVRGFAKDTDRDVKHMAKSDMGRTHEQEMERHSEMGGAGSHGGMGAGGSHGNAHGGY